MHQRSLRRMGSDIAVDKKMMPLQRVDDQYSYPVIVDSCVGAIGGVDHFE